MSIITNHRIADISFYTRTDVFIPEIHNVRFSFFNDQIEMCDVYHFFHGINDHDLVLSPLTSSERERIVRCNIQHNVNLSTTTFPLFIFPKDRQQLKFYNPNSPIDLLDVPLLRSILVRERLEQCSDHFDGIFLILHACTVEIRDYEKHRIDIFYLKAFENNLQLDWMRTSINRLFRTFHKDFNAFMVHSSGVIRREKAVLFLAPDGGGKTTVVSEMPFYTILGDDQIIIRRQNNEILVHSTPWNKIVKGPLFGPSWGDFFVRKI